MIKTEQRAISREEIDQRLQKIATNAFTKLDAAKIRFSVRATKETRLMADITADFAKQ